MSAVVSIISGQPDETAVHTLYPISSRLMSSSVPAVNPGLSVNPGIDSSATPSRKAAVASTPSGSNSTSKGAKANPQDKRSKKEREEAERLALQAEEEARNAVPKSGNSRFEFPNGAVYEGEWVVQWVAGPAGNSVPKKVRQGKGMYIHNGEVYEGDFVQDRIEGVGKYRFASGNVYEGELVNGQFNGRGSYHWTNGASYSGEWQCNRMHGRGVFLTSGGERFQGLFHNNRFQNDSGHGIEPQSDIKYR